MAKTVKPVATIGNILSMTLEDVMEDRFSAYAKDIIQDRALPDARDGLKPAQRRIIYSMALEGNTYNRPTRKSAKTVGNVIGTLHPHGDASVYDAMVRMSQDWKMRLPLIEMQGNNGSIDDDPAAAMRYTEARLSKASEQLTKDLDKNTVNWAPNYDDTLNEPTVLPARFPNLLVNGAKGIAEGYSTEIAPHNLGEVIDGCIELINNPDASLNDIMKHIPGPDFPTGGIIQGTKGIEDAFSTGKGAIVVRSKVDIVTTGKSSQLVITEIPYDVIKHDLIMRINKIRFDKEINGISDVIDETDLNGLKIVVELKEGVDPKLVLNYLYKKTNLQTNFNYNMVAIVDRCPKQLGLLEMLKAFIAHRIEVITRRSQYELEKKENRRHIIEGLIKAISILDEIIKTIRASKDKADSKNNLMNQFGFTEVQAEAIVTMQLYRLSNTDITALKDEDNELNKEIKRLKKILSDKETINELMVDELNEIKTLFPQPRKTLIEQNAEEIVIDRTQMIAHEDTIVTLSKDGYVKRVSLRSYNAVSNIITGLKENDELIGNIQTDTHNLLLAFTDQGNYFCLPIYQIDEMKWKDIGNHISKYLKVSNGEKIVDAFITPTFKSYCWILSITAKGKIKRTPLHEFELQRYSKESLGIKLANGDQVVRTLVAYKNDQLIVLSRKGFTYRYDVETIPVNSTRGAGVNNMNLEKGDLVSFADTCSSKDSDVIIIGEEAQVKRLKISDITQLKRPAKGELVAKLIKSKPIFTKYCYVGKIDSTLPIINADLENIQLKDISLMSKESTYSSINVNLGWFLEKGIDMIEEIELPEQEEKMPSNDNYDLIQFEIEE